MRQFNLTILLTVFINIVGVKTFAHDIEVANADGVTICYKFINAQKELEVTYRGSSYSNPNYVGNVVIPESVIYAGNTYSVTAIGDSAFYHCSGLTGIAIPNSITTLNKSVFAGCSGLTKVTIPNNVTYIGSNAFAACSSLTEVTIGNSVMTIREYALYDCYSLEKIVVESGNPFYDSRENCNAIIRTGTNELIAGCKNTKIPNSVTHIGSSAFHGCSGLTEVIIPNSVTYIGSNAFGGCSGLAEVTIPNSVTYIGTNLFGGCVGLEKIVVESGNPNYDSRENCNAIIRTGTNELIAGCKNTQIPNSVTSIGEFAFNGCWTLTTMTIPNSVTSIGRCAFQTCRGLTKLTLSNSIASIDDFVFNGCSGLLEVTIPNSVTSIGEHAFSNCSSLTELVIPNSVTSIGSYAFNYCIGLTKVTIGNSVASISPNAFRSCNKLATLYSFNTTPPSLGDINFTDNQYMTVNVYVPQEALVAYRSADVWKNFQNLKAFVNGIAIDEVNFPDENFRNYLLAQSYGKDALLTEDEIQSITRFDVSGRGISSLKGIEYFSMLTELLCYNNLLTALDVTQNTMLRYLDCDENQLTALDVTRNTALTELYCGDNQLTSLDVTQNILLTNLQCRDNPLTAIDVTQNTALIWFYCFNNQLTTLNVSRNTALKGLYCDENKLTVLNLSENTELMALDCFNNQLTALDLSKNTMLDYLDCSRNHIEGASMNALISSLPQNTANKDYTFHVYDNSKSDEGNVCTKSQVAKIKAKGWVPYYYDNIGNNWVKYEGTEDEPVYPTSITLPEMETVNVNSTIQLTPTIEPAGAVTELAWLSDDESIAKVTSKGLVAGIKAGTAIISVRTLNNLIAECFVIVQDVSGIEDVNADNTTGVSIYTLSGQKVTKPVKGGIYIINGKKTVMK